MRKLTAAPASLLMNPCCTRTTGESIEISVCYPCRGRMAVWVCIPERARVCIVLYLYMKPNKEQQPVSAVTTINSYLRGALPPCSVQQYPRAMYRWMGMDERAFRLCRILADDEANGRRAKSRSHRSRTKLKADGNIWLWMELEWKPANCSIIW